jgi:hypothetical protein
MHPYRGLQTCSPCKKMMIVSGQPRTSEVLTFWPLNAILAIFPCSVMWRLRRLRTRLSGLPRSWQTGSGRASATRLQRRQLSSAWLSQRRPRPRIWIGETGSWGYCLLYGCTHIRVLPAQVKASYPSPERLGSPSLNAQEADMCTKVDPLITGHSTCSGAAPRPVWWTLNIIIVSTDST